MITHHEPIKYVDRDDRFAKHRFTGRVFQILSTINVYDSVGRHVGFTRTLKAIDSGNTFTVDDEVFFHQVYGPYPEVEKKRDDKIVKWFQWVTVAMFIAVVAEVIYELS